MKNSILFLWLMIMTASLAYTQTPVRVMTFNIRYANPQDAEKGNGWEQRRDKMVALIKHYNPDLLGIQEALKHQLDYLLANLEGYEYIGVARDDGKEKGEYSAILYKKGRFELKHSNTFWLSETPEKPSKSWDAALPRIVTWGAFDDKINKKSFYYFNTHFDHIGVQARVNSAKLILRKINEIAGKEGPVVLTGDFNVTPDAEPYQVLAETLNDTRKMSQEPPYGPEGTFSGFELTSTAEFPRIDYIFVREFNVQSHEAIADFFTDKFPSDHLPVMAVIDF